MKRAFVSSFVALALSFVVPQPARATFHLMQIEQVIGGVDGNTGVQAVQLRMRAAGQNLMGQARMFAWNAAGASPVLLIDFTTSVAASAAGSRVLAATASFAASTSPNLAPDYVLASPIPVAYLNAGSLTFEDDFGTVYWRLSWGGANYTGSNAGNVINDTDANFGPPFPLPLPFQSGRALQFTGAANAQSTSNSAQYALTAGAATFTRNNGNSAAINTTVSVGDDWAGTSLALGRPIPNPAASAVSYTVSLPRAAHVRVRAFDLRGRVVATLEDRDMPAGRHNLTWDVGSDSPQLAAGVYLLVLEAEGRRAVQRVVFLRGDGLREPHGE